MVVGIRVGKWRHGEKKRCFWQKHFLSSSFFVVFIVVVIFFDPATPALLSATSVRGEYISLSVRIVLNSSYFYGIDFFPLVTLPIKRSRQASFLLHSFSTHVQSHQANLISFFIHFLCHIPFTFPPCQSSQLRQDKIGNTH